jgi:hypothetical protein
MFPKRHQMDGVVYPVPALDDVGLGIEFNEAYVVYCVGCTHSDCTQ